MSWLKRSLNTRMLLPMLGAAVVFLLASGTLGGYDGASFAQGVTPAPTANPGAPLPGGSPAEGQLETSGPNGTRQSCSSFEEAQGGFLLGRIVPCLTKTIEHAGNRMSREMIEALRPLLYAFLTFVIIMFGLQVLQNEGQLQTRAFVLLIKIGFTFAILAAIPGDEDTNEGGLIGVAYGIMAESQAVVMSALGPESGNMHCQMEVFGDENTPMIWKQMDCLLSKLYGFTVGTPGPSGEARPNMLLASSVIGMLGGFFFNSSFGVALFLACIGMLASMFMLILRVVVAFLNSYMFIAFYMILAPLLLPLMFLKVTTSMFEKWYSGILAALLLPLIVCAYVVLALQVYDKLFFADDAMITKLFNNQFMDRARQLPKAVCDQRISNNAGFRADATGRTEQEIYTDNLLLQNINPYVSGANNLCGGLKAANLNLDGVFTDENGNTISSREAFEKLFFDCIKLFVLSMLINMGFTTIMGAVRPMLGSGAVVAAVEQGTPLESKIRSGIQGAKKGLNEGFQVQNKDGEWVASKDSDFIRQMPKAFAESGKGFLTGMGVINPNAPSAGSGNAGGTGAAGGAGGGAGGGSAPSNTGKGQSDGGGKAGGDSGGDDSDSGGNKSADRGGAAASPNAAQRPSSVRSGTPAQQIEMAEALIPEKAARFQEIQDQLYSNRLDPTERINLKKEYEELLDLIEERSNKGGA